MNNKTILSFFGGVVLGGILGGYFVGVSCAKRYKEQLTEAENRNDLLAKELEKTAERALSEPLKGIVEPQTNECSIDGYSEALSDYVSMSEEETKPDIRIITQQEFSENVHFKDSETLTYYVEDSVLADEFDMPVHDEEKTIGMECLEKLENATEDDEYFYVDNLAEEKMYEIIVEHNESFYRDVLGGE